MTGILHVSRPDDEIIEAHMECVVIFSASVAVKELCMALAVSNAAGVGKRADIVFYGLTFEILLFF